VPTTCDLSKLVALAPPGAGRIHLHLPDYQPGNKPRSQDNAPLCGVFVHRGLEQAPLDVALDWPHVRATWAGSGDAGERYWCGPCLGRLVELLGYQDDMIRTAMAVVSLAQVNNQNASLTPHMDMGSVPLVRPDGPETEPEGHGTGT
jgi:hypothetical protein